MILQALVQYYESLAKLNKVSKPGWCEAKVSHAIELNEDGTIKGIHYRKNEEERGRTREKDCMGAVKDPGSGNGKQILGSFGKLFMR